MFTVLHNTITHLIVSSVTTHSEKADMSVLLYCSLFRKYGRSAFQAEHLFSLMVVFLLTHYNPQILKVDLDVDFYYKATY